MDARSLRAILRTLREAGVTRFKSADLEIELGPLPAAPVQAPAPPERIEVTTEEPADPLETLFLHERAGA